MLRCNLGKCQLLHTVAHHWQEPRQEQWEQECLSQLFIRYNRHIGSNDTLHYIVQCSWTLKESSTYAETQHAAKSLAAVEPHPVNRSYNFMFLPTDNAAHGLGVAMPTTQLALTLHIQPARRHLCVRLCVQMVLPLGSEPSKRSGKDPKRDSEMYPIEGRRVTSQTGEVGVVRRSPDMGALRTALQVGCPHKSQVLPSSS